MLADEFCLNGQAVHIGLGLGFVGEVALDLSFGLGEGLTQGLVLLTSGFERQPHLFLFLLGFLKRVEGLLQGGVGRLKV